MGVVSMALDLLFGGRRNVVTETLGAFQENVEASAMREAAFKSAALAQFAAEFSAKRKGRFDRIMDGLNRIPRPAMAFGTLGLFISSMVDPVWFASRMQGIALVPEPLWWLLGAIVSFYFGARFQVKSQDFQRDLAGSLAQTHTVLNNIAALDDIEADRAENIDAASDNPALDEWQATHAK